VQRTLARPFLDLRTKMNTELTRGFVGRELAPDFTATGHVFLMYTYDDRPTPDDGVKAYLSITEALHRVHSVRR
jgi:hypothetical protein